MANNEFKLLQEIISRSVFKTWDQARLEWSIYSIHDAEDEPEQCLCSHYPIIEICTLQNKFNGFFVTVGNCCVKKFMGLSSDKLFQSIRRVRKDIKKSLTPDLIDHAYNKKWITEWDRTFYIDIWRKRLLSTKQMEQKTRINRIIIGSVIKKSASQN